MVARTRAAKPPSRGPKTALDETAFLGICCPSRRRSQNAQRLFMPASTTKLYTSWLACESLGEDHVFHSGYAVDGKTLYVAPMGNPLLSEDSFRGMLQDVGGRTIEEIALVRQDLPGLPYPATWAIGDIRESWGAPVADICFHENYATVDGSTDRVLAPSGNYFTVQRAEGIRAPRVEGSVVSLPAGFTGTYDFPILDPGDFLFSWLRERLGGTARRRRSARLPGAPTRFGEAPLRDVLKTMNKKSSNILAELLLVHSAQALHKPLDYEQPQAVYREVLEPIGVRDVLLYDGSGVSRYNLVSPRSTVALLEAARKYPSILDSLPIGGVDGTLADRRLPRRIRAKTGSLTGVQALAGYDDGDPFTVMINHGPPDEAALVQAIDRIVRAL